ncbi:GGDEF domain-containing protein [Vibrio sp. TBV020]|uniref:GGDEF domain-containing protein n=1 Tax=Vibrio sp. TBV020 TaxID=3137398 RepID=UPI0038CD9138
MWKQNNYNAPSSLLIKAKYLLLLLSVIVVAANLYFLNSTRQHAESYSEQQNQATWFLFQLTKEFSELNTIAPFYEEVDDYHYRIELKYELTWSRFDLLLTSKEADTFITLPGAREYFQTLFNQFKALEPRVISLDSKADADKLGQEFDLLYMSMINFVNTNFRVKSPLYETQMQTARDLNHIQLVLLFLLVGCIALVMFILQKESEFHKEQSLTDSLTGIANRLALFNDLKYQTREDQPFTIYLLDLNGFKEVNDQYGHQAGDKVLKAFGKRLNEVSPLSYRIGGDEFALITRTTSLIELKQLSRTIAKEMTKPIRVTESDEVVIGTSIGFASYPNDAHDTNELLLIADSKMYVEKQNGRKIIG